MVDVTANATVFPSANDIAETAKEGRFATEQSFANDYIFKVMQSHIVSGFAFPATDPDLVLTVPNGEAIIEGKRVVISTSTNITLAANQTNHIFLQLSVDGNGDVDNVDMISNTTGAQPVRSVKIGQAITDGSTVTSTVDKDRIADPYFFQDNHFYAETGKLAIAAGGFATLPSFSAGSNEIFVYVPRSAEFINIALNVFGGTGGGGGPAEVRLSVEGTNKTITGPSESVVLGATQVVIVSAFVRDLILFSPGRFLKVKVQGGQTATINGAQCNDDDTAFAAPGGTTEPIDGIKFFSLTDRSDS